jgi:replicative DNA helicase
MEKILMPAPIEFIVQDIDGKEIALSAKSISRKMMTRINDIAKKADAEDNKDTSGILHEQMAVFFGGVSEDYDNLDFRVIKEVLKRVTEEIKGKDDPTQRQGKK